jgi:secernin
MCDTLLATPSATAEQVMLFGKNSDRQRNEAQSVEFHPRAEHADHAPLKCTYLTIPQSRHTHAVLLCRPFWMWGAEMGANEHGVVIGNEGLHARAPAPEKPALTGMDLVRLGLERAHSAAAAVDLMTQLLERYGQGGNCGHLTPNYYNNGFLIADATEAYVLETVGKEWLTERIRGVRTLSNVYSIGRAPQGVSTGLPLLIHESGWSTEREPHYAEVITNPHREHIGHAGERRARSTSLLRAQMPRLTALDMMRALRDHGPDAASGALWRPDRSSVTLCMHAGGEDRPGQTVGSLVSEVHSAHTVHWVTASAAPCISLFKPLILEAPLPPQGPAPSDQFDPRSFWWRHEELHRTALMGDFGGFLARISHERDSLEAKFHAQIREVLNGGDAADRARVIANCWAEASALETRWMSLIGEMDQRSDSGYQAAWLAMDRTAGMSDLPAHPKQ